MVDDACVSSMDRDGRSNAIANSCGDDSFGYFLFCISLQLQSYTNTA